MRAISGEPVEVWPRHGKPARFVWRGRLYTVLFVLDKRTVPAGRPAGEAAPGEAAPGEAGPGEVAQAGGRECWVVEATPVRAVPASIFELCFDAAADRWTLSRS